MNITPIKTRALVPPQDDLFAVFAESLPKLSNDDIVAITSKVVAIHQGRTRKITTDSTRDELAIAEADYYLPREQSPGGHILHTIKHHTTIASSGIDESNADGHFVFLPKEPQQVAREIYVFLKEQYNLDTLGVLITDSHSTPMRGGVVGVGIGFWGFEPLKDYRGQEDIFGRPFKYVQTNIVDSLAAAAVYAMGEGNEQTPVAIITDLADIVYTENDCYAQLVRSREEDIYYPLFKGYIKGGSSDLA